MSEPANQAAVGVLRAFQNVTIADSPYLRSVDLAGRRATVTQVRRYPNGDIKYSLSGHYFADNEVAGVYRDEDLQAGNGFAPMRTFALGGPFLLRELVQVAEDYPDGDRFRGEIGWVHHARKMQTPGQFLIGVTFEQLEDIKFVPDGYLRATGQRMTQPDQRPSGNISATLSDESEDGAAMAPYVIVDDVEWYL